MSRTPPVLIFAALVFLLLPVVPHGQSFKVKQQCPPCAAIARAQGGVDEVAPEALADRQWALKKNGINLESMPDGLDAIRVLERRWRSATRCDRNAAYSRSSTFMGFLLVCGGVRAWGRSRPGPHQRADRERATRVGGSRSRSTS